MTRKRPAGPADRDRAEGAAEDSVEDSLNQILAEADPASTVIPDTEAPTDEPGARPAETAEAPAAPIEGAASGDAASAPAVEAPEPESESAVISQQEAVAEVDVEVEVDAEVDAAIESVSLAIDDDDDAVAAPHTPSELASMSGPALVDDVREEQTDVETPEAMAAAAAAAERALASGEAAPDRVGTPVRVDSADLANPSMVAADEITATGGGTRESGDVITAENLEYFTAPKEAAKLKDAGGAPTSPGLESAGGEPSLAAQSREERERALHRPAGALPADEQDVGEEPSEMELEMGALDYEHNRPSASPDGGNDATVSLRAGGGAESWAPAGMAGAAFGHEPSGARLTTPIIPGGSGSGRHALPPPSARGATPTPGRMRMPTPKPSVPTPGPRITGQAIPIPAPAGSSGSLQVARNTTSAVFNKVQLPLGGLVTVVGAAFGVGLILGALIWRGSAEPAAEANWHGDKDHSDKEKERAATATAPTAPAPTPALAPAPTEPAPTAAAAPSAPAAEATAASAAAAVPAPTPVTPPSVAPAAAPVAPAAMKTGRSGPASAAVAGTTGGVTTASKKVASATAKTVRTKKPAQTAATGKTDGASKSRGAAWVDPFAQ